MTEPEDPTLRPAQDLPTKAVCRRCGGPYPEVLTEPDEFRCPRCGWLASGDPSTVHDWLNGRALAKPLARTCHTCGAAVKDANLCAKCVRNVKAWLRTVPELAPELDLAISKQARFAEEHQRVKGTATAALPLQPMASDAYHALKHVLVNWMLFIEEEMAA